MNRPKDIALGILSVLTLGAPTVEAVDIGVMVVRYDSLEAVSGLLNCGPADQLQRLPSESGVEWCGNEHTCSLEGLVSYWGYGGLCPIADGPCRTSVRFSTGSNRYWWLLVVSNPSEVAAAIASERLWWNQVRCSGWTGEDIMGPMYPFHFFIPISIPSMGLLEGWDSHIGAGSEFEARVVATDAMGCSDIERRSWLLRQGVSAMMIVEEYGDWYAAPEWLQRLFWISSYVVADLHGPPGVTPDELGFAYSYPPDWLQEEANEIGMLSCNIWGYTGDCTLTSGPRTTWGALKTLFR